MLWHRVPIPVGEILLILSLGKKSLKLTCNIYRFKFTQSLVPHGPLLMVLGKWTMREFRLSEGTLNHRSILAYGGNHLIFQISNRSIIAYTYLGTCITHVSGSKRLGCYHWLSQLTLVKIGIPLKWIRSIGLFSLFTRKELIPTLKGTWPDNFGK